jgi:hypothetical protein
MPIEIELRDKISAGIKEIAANLKALRLEAAQSGIGSSDSFTKVAHETRSFQQTIVNATDNLQAMGGRVSGLAGSILGVTGAAGAVVLLGKNLENFATNRVRLSAFSRDTGLLTTEVQRTEQAMRRMGYSGEEARGYVGSLMGQLRTMHAMGRDVERSPLWKGLGEMGQHGVAVANDLMQLMDAGKWNEAMHRLIHFYKAQNSEAQTYISNLLGGIPPSLLLSLEDYEKQVKYLFDGDEKRAAEYLGHLEDIRGKIKGEWYLIAEHVIGVLNNIFRKYDEAGEQHGFSEWVIGEFDAIIKAATEAEKVLNSLLDLVQGKSGGGGAFATAQAAQNFGPAFVATGGMPQTEGMPFEQPQPEMLRRYQAGTARVQKTGLAVVHEGEAIVPARDAIKAVPSDKQMFDALGGVRGIIGGLLGRPNNPTIATKDYFPEKHWAPGSKPKLWSPEWGDELIDMLGLPHEYQPQQQEAGLQDDSETIQFAESKKDSKQKLDEVRDILTRMEQKNINLPNYQSGTTDVPETGYAKLHKDEVLLPAGHKVERTGPAMVFKGEQVVPAGIANQMGFIGAIGATETDFSRKEAYSEKYNQPGGGGINRNIAASPREAAKFADYGFFQMNQAQVNQAVKMGMDPATAKHLHGGGPGGRSTLSEQVGALHEYMQLKYGKLYEDVAGGSKQAFETLRRQAGQEWHGLRDKPEKALKIFTQGTTAITAAQAAEERERVDQSAPQRRSGAINFKVRANAVPPGVKVNTEIGGPLFEDGQFTSEQSKQMPTWQ